MITEGLGSVAPVPRCVKLTLPELRALYESAKTREHYRSYSARNDTWGKGLIGDIELPGIGIVPKSSSSVFVGMLGEYAVCNVINSRFPGTVETDLALKMQGDFGVDIKAFGLTLQVKTRKNRKKQSLVKRQNGNGPLLSVPVHGFCFCEWTPDAVSHVWVLGWVWSKTILEKEPEQSMHGPWSNAVIDDTELKSISTLRDELEAWKNAWKDKEAG